MTRHRLDLFSLFAGLVFTAVAVLALNPGWATGAAEWVWPAILVGGGVVALVSSLAADRREPTVEVLAEADPHEVAPHHLDQTLVAEARTEVEEADPFTP